MPVGGSGASAQSSAAASTSAPASGSPTLAESGSAASTVSSSSAPVAGSSTAVPARADQTGVGTSHVSLSGHGPLALLTSRETQPDGTIRITWQVNQEEVLEACRRGGVGSPTDRSSCDDPAALESMYGSLLGTTGEATASCGDALITTAALPAAGSSGQVRTLRKVDDDWVGESTGEVRGASTVGGGGNFDSMLTAACDPGRDMFASHFNGTSQTSTPNTASSSAVAMSCGAGRQLVGYSEQWQVCKPRNAPISDGFAMTVADAVTGPGQYRDVVSPANGTSYYFSCSWHTYGQGDVGVNTLVCGEDPTNIENGRVELIPHGG